MLAWSENKWVNAYDVPASCEDSDYIWRGESVGWNTWLGISLGNKLMNLVRIKRPALGDLRVLVEASVMVEGSPIVGMVCIKPKDLSATDPNDGGKFINSPQVTLDQFQNRRLSLVLLSNDYCRSQYFKLFSEVPLTVLEQNAVCFFPLRFVHAAFRRVRVGEILLRFLNPQSGRKGLEDVPSQFVRSVPMLMLDKTRTYLKIV